MSQPTVSLDLDEEFYRRLLTRAHFELCRAGALGRSDPLDLAQDVLLELYEMARDGRLTTVEPRELLSGLAATIARRRAIDLARRHSTRFERPASHPEAAGVGTSAALDRLECLSPGTSTRLRRLDARESATRILDFVARREAEDPALAGTYELLVMRCVDDLSYEEIAARRGRGESTESVRSRLRRLEAEIRGAFAAPRP